MSQDCLKKTTELSAEIETFKENAKEKLASYSQEDSKMLLDLEGRIYDNCCSVMNKGEEFEITEYSAVFFDENGAVMAFFDLDEEVLYY